MKRIKGKTLKTIMFVIAVMVFSCIAILGASAYFRDRIVVALSDKDAAVVSLEKGADKAVAITDSLNTHFGDWVTGDSFIADFQFSYSGNIDAFAVPQLDLVGSDGKNYNARFEGKYKINNTEYGFAVEQLSDVRVSHGDRVNVEYSLEVRENLPPGIIIVPEFKCAALQYTHNENLKASFRKILDDTDTEQTGFYDYINCDNVYDSKGSIFTSTYGADTYESKTLKFSVKADGKASGHQVTVYKLHNPEVFTSFPSEYKLKDSVTDENYEFRFYARKGMNCSVIVDAQNKEAGHSVCAYRITWPMSGSLNVETLELDKNGNMLN